jgi:hypothetical protein
LPLSLSEESRNFPGLTISNPFVSAVFIKLHSIAFNFGAASDFHLRVQTIGRAFNRCGEGKKKAWRVLAFLAPLRETKIFVFFVALVRNLTLTKRTKSTVVNNICP